MLSLGFKEPEIDIFSMALKKAKLGAFIEYISGFERVCIGL